MRLFTNCAGRAGPEKGKGITMIGAGGLWLTQGQRIRGSHMVVDMEPGSGRGGQVYPCAMDRYEP